MEEKYFLKARNILIGEDLEVLKTAGLIIEDGKIKDIILEDNFGNISKDYRVIDFGEKTLMPGMIECHSHLVMSATEKGHLETVSKRNEAEMALVAIDSLKKDLESGVTTARSLGDLNNIEFTMRELLKQDKIAGPDLLISGPAIRSLHGFSFLGIPHNGPEEVRLTVRQNLLKNVDTIKLFTTPGMLNVGEEVVKATLTREEIEIAVNEAHRVGTFVTAHCAGGEALQDCSNLGVDVLEHAYFATDEDIETLLKNNTWVGLTSGIYLDEEREQYLAQETIDKVRYGREQVFERLSKLIKAGVKFSIGTDAYHGKLYKEVILAEKLGASRLDALKGVTSNAAIVCQRGDRIGRIEKGYEADIIALDKNPLDNLSTLENVSFVMKKGKTALNKI